MSPEEKINCHLHPYEFFLRDIENHCYCLFKYNFKELFKIFKAVHIQLKNDSKRLIVSFSISNHSYHFVFPFRNILAFFIFDFDKFYISTGGSQTFSHVYCCTILIYFSLGTIGFRPFLLFCYYKHRYRKCTYTYFFLYMQILK